MSDPKWVSRPDVEFIHEGVIEVGGGSHGLRDPSLLESALGRPQNQHAYGETDIFQLAAGYAEAISRNHPFVDGNKRTAFQTAHQFLKDNGYRLERAKGVEHAEMMERLGQGHVTREDMGKYLAAHSHEIHQDIDEIKRRAEERLRKQREDRSQKPGQDQGEDI